jgi:hypothetical protein
MAPRRGHYDLKTIRITIAIGMDGASRTLRASDNLPATRGNVDAGHGLVVSGKLILQCEAVSRTVVKLDAGVTSDSKQASIGAEGVVGNGLMEQQIDFGGRHYDD